MEEVKRKLAHIEKIGSLESIPGADNIVKATCLGWELVVKKDEFKVGDLCCYIEIDSVCDITKPHFEFLKDTKGRIKTRKFKKSIAQGLALPLSILPPITGTFYKLEEGLDITDLLCIKHYDSESPLNQKVEYKPQNKFIKHLLKYSLFRKIILPFIRKPKGAWPQWIQKTDELRIQNAPGILESYKDKSFYVTEKLDGTSTTFFLKKMKFGLINRNIFGTASRNIWLKTEDESYYWKMARKYDIESILRKDGRELILQGETIGPSIQKNKYGIQELEFYVFNIIDSKDGRHFDLNETEEFCNNNNLKLVPIIERETVLKSTVKEIVDLSIGKSKLNSKTEREGLVFRYIENGNKISFKAISPTFLLKHDC